MEVAIDRQIVTNKEHLISALRESVGFAINFQEKFMDPQYTPANPGLFRPRREDLMKLELMCDSMSDAKSRYRELTANERMEIFGSDGGLGTSARAIFELCSYTSDYFRSVGRLAEFREVFLINPFPACGKFPEAGGRQVLEAFDSLRKKASEVLGVFIGETERVL